MMQHELTRMGIRTRGLERNGFLPRLNCFIELLYKVKQVECKFSRLTLKIEESKVNNKVRVCART